MPHANSNQAYACGTTVILPSVKFQMLPGGNSQRSVGNTRKISITSSNQSLQFTMPTFGIPGRRVHNQLKSTLNRLALFRIRPRISRRSPVTGGDVFTTPRTD